MKLSDAAKSISIEVVRDGIFTSLGIIAHDTNNMLTFLYNEKFLPELTRKTNITCVITDEQLANKLPSTFGIALSSDPRQAFYAFHNFLYQETDFYWKHFPTEISEDAKVHPTAHVASMDVRIGRRVIIEPHATILERTIIQDDVIIRSGAVIGCQGYEFKHLGDTILPVAHAGGVLLHPRVEIQGNTVVDRAVFGGFTEVGEDVKMDNLVSVAHNVRIGRRSRVGALAAIAGSVTIGEDAWIGPSAVISHGLRIGDRAYVTLGAVVTKDVEPGHRVSGNFAIEHSKFLAFLKGIR